MLLFLRRPLRIVTGYLCGCVTAALGLAMVVVATLPDHSIRELLPNLVGVTVGLTRMAAIVGLIPSTVAIAIFEWRAERRLWIYATFAACLSAVAAGFISGAFTPAVDSTGAITSLGGSALLGALAGAVYWCMAGRAAGRLSSTVTVSGRG